MGWPSTDFEVEIQRELNFLQFFYGAVSDYLGPADSDVYEAIKAEYIDEVGEEDFPERY